MRRFLFCNSEVRNYNLVMVTILKTDSVFFPIRIFRFEDGDFIKLQIRIYFLKFFQRFRIENQDVIVI